MSSKAVNENSDAHTRPAALIGVLARLCRIAHLQLVCPSDLMLY
jgi:hypothetical protein